jgi:hypothetical protein
VWHKFQSLAAVFLGLVILGEGYRFFSAGNIHAGIDAGFCSYFAADICDRRHLFSIRNIFVGVCVLFWALLLLWTII